MTNKNRISDKEKELRRWFVRDRDRIDAEIDGLDIGWGGVQRWMTSKLPLSASSRHLDFACGYATFIAQLAWRFPQLQIVGLNIDFEGPHALAAKLVVQAGVADRCEFVRADAREMPFPDGSFDSVSCFLGLQDIEIGFGDAGVRAAIEQAARVLKPRGILAIADEFSPERLELLLTPSALNVLTLQERELDTQWNREAAERAIELYADGWQGQVRSGEPAVKERARKQARARMRGDMERQFAKRNFYVPFGPIRLIVARKRPS